jgi:hypothetical protein
MNQLKLLLCAGTTVAGLAWAGSALADDQATPPAPAAAPAAPAPSPMPYPAVTAPMAANPNPATFDAGPIGNITVDGVISGDAFYQSNPAPNGFGNQNKDYYFDTANAMVIINKSNGPVQFYFQAGAYSVVALGSTYLNSSQQDKLTFGYFPQGFLKFVPMNNFSVEVGALPTLIGGEYEFSFENMNIERGLLWGQEPAISKGVQVNYSSGSWAGSLALTDGYYSNDYTNVSGLLTYTFKNADTLTFAGEGNAGRYVAPSFLSTFVTPVQQDNGVIINLLYSHSSGPWTISPYFQYSNSPSIAGISAQGDTYGAAVLAKYSFTPEVSLSGRVEYEGSDGPANLLGFGVNSSAYSITITPAYQKGIFFMRGEFSYTGIGSGTPGLMFGSTNTATNQVRILGEAGLLF